MANILAPYSGRATFSIDSVPDSGSPEPLLAQDRFGFDSAVILDSVGAWRVWKVRLMATTRAVYESWVAPLLLSNSRRVRVRWGVDTGVDVVWAPAEFCRVLTVDATAQNSAAPQSGYPFDMVLVGPLYELSLVQKVAARSGSISSIVEAIATDYDLKTVVEPTSGAPVALIQSYETDLDFIRSRLLPSAVNGSGEAGYYLYVDDGTLHFHTRGYKQEPWVLPYNPLGAHLLSSDDVQDNAQAGGTGSQIVVYDPLSARTQVVDAEPSRYTKFGKRLATADGQALMSAHAGPNQAAFELNRNQANYALRRDRFERASFSLANTIDLRAGKILKVQLSDSSDPTNGFYHVERVDVTIDGGTASLATTVARGEVNGGRSSGGSVTGAASAPAPVAAPFDAPGREPNFSSPSAQIGQGVGVAVRPAGG